MSVFDVRDNNPTVQVIKFADTHDSYVTALEIHKHESGGDHVIKITDGGFNAEFVLVASAEDARNLQAALSKAIELGWLV